MSAITLDLTCAHDDPVIALWNVDRIEEDERIAFLSVIAETNGDLTVLMYDEDGEAFTIYRRS